MYGMLTNFAVNAPGNNMAICNLQWESIVIPRDAAIHHLLIQCYFTKTHQSTFISCRLVWTFFVSQCISMYGPVFEYLFPRYPYFCCGLYAQLNGRTSITNRWLSFFISQKLGIISYLYVHFEQQPACGASIACKIAWHPCRDLGLSERW